jgi:hypothetical protein
VHSRRFTQAREPTILEYFPVVANYDDACEHIAQWTQARDRFTLARDGGRDSRADDTFSSQPRHVGTRYRERMRT